ncbi:hypothetical protein C2E25_14315 [Geothermobacter hydrogeniphilus]|uniref:Uncharacterized protein n=1 Tax=Geothermobacter hydrogeniphilus TaxID=1969733 RepID=A0A2K2H716_9BACT|nr:hypothetical protein C2E25_14315 [Geothermobacter hydrogeniphilus]
MHFCSETAAQVFIGLVQNVLPKPYKAMNGIKLKKYLLSAMVDCFLTYFGIWMYVTGKVPVKNFEIGYAKIDKWQAIPMILAGVILLGYHTYDLNFRRQKNLLTY